MDEMISLLEEIRDLLIEMNGKLDDIKGYGSDNSISDVCDKINEISSNGFYGLRDVCDKLDSIETAIDLK